MRYGNHGPPRGQHDTTPDACPLGDLFTAHHVQILRHLAREGTLVLNIVAVDEHGHDECGENKAGLEGSVARKVRSESHEGKIHEAQAGTGSENPGRRTPWSLLARAVHAMNPTG